MEPIEAASDPHPYAAKDRELVLTTLQNTVTRLAGYSFGAKGWAITVTSAFAAAAATQRQPNLVLGAVLPCLFFWWMDAYYLMLERRFRRRYLKLLDDRTTRVSSGVFTDTTVEAAEGFLDACFSGMLAFFYIALALAAVFIAYLL